MGEAPPKKNGRGRKGKATDLNQEEKGPPLEEPPKAEVPTKKAARGRKGKGTEETEKAEKVKAKPTSSRGEAKEAAQKEEGAEVTGESQSKKLKTVRSRGKAKEVP